MLEDGKSLNLFLIDGVPTGRIKCTLANWTGVVYKIPRRELEKCNYRKDLKQSGVYFLFGMSDDTEENIAYIGQAGVRKNGEGILHRLIEHKKDWNKDYWTEAVVFITSNNSFGPTEMSYLENRFFNLSKEAGRYVIRNSADPNSGNVTEEKESELVEFIEYAKLIMGVLGHNIFDSLQAKVELKIEDGRLIENDGEALLFLNTNGVEARGRRTNEGFVVYKGAVVALKPTNSCPSTIVELRGKYDNRLENGILIKDTLFTSPSAASSFVRYASANGLEEWKDCHGNSLKIIERNEG